MTSENVKRELKAIFYADVKEYGRLMGEDEVKTVQTLNQYRGLMVALILQFQGRVVDSPGDNLLAEFVSVVNALECAVKNTKRTQSEKRQVAAQLPDGFPHRN